ncbi:NAD(P)/FAD-dependent oxidoreductase [Williamsia phyllosphaerae]|uniref:FAD-dependent pyridine nucleotide-disulphide oxidoreductase n=1 Tax=Williamsia phyllosphaerae TaxID=885042 RepID=A0ABQ1V1L4_9NOCA|nr:NAD(P)/FAD-dependent oxidoreductase [Williamsia phyllosphaerae]GGF32062.1 putative FAD-dependent pyridine nucleotide-disulphide oxidoreductase [Williamsia phyllosphaerae]
MDEMMDVAVIGGGAAGLAAAVTLGRQRRSVVVVDAGSPRNLPADGVHNFLTREGISPTELVTTGRAEVELYGGRVVSGTASRVDGGVGDFTVTLDDGSAVRARRLVVTTGVVDELPDVAGLAQRWGRDVLHCPFCHGWEVRDRAVVVIATSVMSAHQAHMFRNLSADVTIARHTAPEFVGEQLETLTARDIGVVDGLVTEVVVRDDRLVGVRLASGAEVACDAVVVASTGRVGGAVVESLGLTVEEVRVGDHLMATVIATDPMGATGVPGVWAAGNVADARATVVASAAGGVNVAMAVHASLMEDDIADAVATRRAMTAVG